MNNDDELGRIAALNNGLVDLFNKHRLVVFFNYGDIKQIANDDDYVETLGIDEHGNIRPILRKGQPVDWDKLIGDIGNV